MSKTWTSTIKLPKSTFPPRPLPASRDQYIQRCADQLYKWQSENRPAQDPFVLHDGPPYANGNLHVGHALNKVLKDIIIRRKVQEGRRVEYVPGWDCHGLPIELKALEKADGAKQTPLQIRKSARNLAAKTVAKQEKSFRSYGVMSDWEKRWTTMDAAYEMRQLRLFQKMVKQGLIYRKFKPVYWSPSSQTALAEAELEYKDDHVSNSAWIRFPITNWLDSSELQELQSKIKGNLFAAIWTTTPWTLPANRAIAAHNDLKYCVISYGEDAIIVAEDRVSEVMGKLPELRADNVLGVYEGKHLVGLQYSNRLRGQSAPSQPIVHADFVSAESGTGLVHMAPGHGFDDYEVCNAHNIPVAAPIDDVGRFTKDAFPDAPELLESAPSIIEGGGQNVLDLLQERYGDVLLTESYQHKYPYDWRTKKPVVIRATEQWFADVGSIKQDALGALDNVEFFPPSGKKRLESFVQGRSEWCISRQRAWGVPIPALYNEAGKAIVDEQVVDHIVSVMLERGTSAWWSDAPDDPAWVPESLKGKILRRGTDTMDVWFDSGSSWTMMNGQADVYLEGSDQHRGWFQSSLLTRIAAQATTNTTSATKTAPFKQLITHGFTLDQDGKKMSKSIGNIIEPEQVIDGTLLPPMKRKGKAANGPPTYDALGPDALRLWAASSDYVRDVSIGVNKLQTVHTELIKYRVILKMLLGAMHRSAREAPLTTIDHIALIHLKDTMAEVGKAYEEHKFYRGVSVLNTWVHTHLSAFYLEARKDRLYCGDGGGLIEPIFFAFLRMLAPITPLLVEEAWDHRPAWMKEQGESEALQHPLQQLYDTEIIPKERITQDLDQLRGEMGVLLQVHTSVKSVLEQVRSKGQIGSSLECGLEIIVDYHRSLAKEADRVRGALEKHQNELADMFVVSDVKLWSGDSATYPDSLEVDKLGEEDCYVKEEWGDAARVVIKVLKPNHEKCPRCWRFVAEEKDTLCGRCEDVVKELKD
ncbi:isoleucyl-tRNA synthetase [Xylariaceae sp. FL1019]|nr:isoleucyl-tRNA synthetase [Xylariaceae sp. FL1019]